jgi:hypothetical protein
MSAYVWRGWIPKNFHYTRLDNESVEIVLACDYDALHRELERLTMALDAMTKNFLEAS